MTEEVPSNPRTGPSDRIARDLAALVVRRGTGVVAQGILPESCRENFGRVLGEELGDAEVVWVHDIGDEASLEALHRLNGARDLLVPGVALVLVTTPNFIGLRSIRGRAPDLLSFGVFSFEVEEPLQAVTHTLLEALATVNAEAVPACLSSVLGATDELDWIPNLDARVWTLRRDESGVWVEPARDSERATVRVVVGPSGSGRTTWLRRVRRAYLSLQDPLGVGPCTPIYLHCADVVRTLESIRHGSTLLDAVLTCLSRSGLSEAENLRGQASSLLLLLDGLDEVPFERNRRWILDGVPALGVRGVLLADRPEGLDTLPTGAHITPLRELGTEQWATLVAAARRGPPISGGKVGRLPSAWAGARWPLYAVVRGRLLEAGVVDPPTERRSIQQLGSWLVEEWQRRVRVRAPDAGLSRILVVLCQWAAWQTLDGQPLHTDTFGRITKENKGLAELARRSLENPTRVKGACGPLVFRAGEWRFLHPQLAYFFSGARRDDLWWAAMLPPGRPAWEDLASWRAIMGSRDGVQRDVVRRVLTDQAVKPPQRLSVSAQLLLHTRAPNDLHLELARAVVDAVLAAERPLARARAARTLVTLARGARGSAWLGMLAGELTRLSVAPAHWLRPLLPDIYTELGLPLPLLDTLPEDTEEARWREAYHLFSGQPVPA